MRLTLNTTEAQSFELAEPGPYLMTIDKIDEPRKTEKTVVVDIHFAFVDADVSQRCGSIRRTYPIQGKGAGFITELIKVVTGNEIPVGKEGGNIDFDTDELIGKTVQVNVDNEPSNKPGADPNQLYNVAKKIVAA